MINVQVSDALPEVLRAASFANRPLLERAALQALRQAGHDGQPAEDGLTIVIGDDAQLHELNREFLGIDAPTDVLSFPADEVDPDSGERYRGDILISYPRAAAQAETGGHTLQDELQLLVVHGVLHLLGYDHAGAEDKALMWEVQSRVLNQLGITIRP